MDWATNALSDHWGLQHNVDINAFSRDELRPIVAAMAGELVTDWTIAATNPYLLVDSQLTTLFRG